MDFLFDIPVVGILFQLVDYMIQVLTLNGAVILALDVGIDPGQEPPLPDIAHLRMLADPIEVSSQAVDRAALLLELAELLPDGHSEESDDQ